MRAKKVYVSLSFGSICCVIVPVALADVAAVSLDWSQLQTNVFASKGQPVPTLSFFYPTQHEADVYRCKFRRLGRYRDAKHAELDGRWRHQCRHVARASEYVRVRWSGCRERDFI
jgi:hypothetical protein